jgi:hypothetical protein
VKIKTREKLLILAAGLGIALLAGDRLVVKPLTGFWKARTTRIAELTKSINTGTALLKREKFTRDRWTLMRTYALPSNVSAAESKVFTAVERWTQSSRITRKFLTPQWKQGANDFMTLDCRIGAEGNMPSVARFLFELEKDPLALKVDELMITTRDKEGQQLSLDVRFSGLLLNTNPK